MKAKVKPPKFVWLNKTALRYQENKSGRGYYYRDAGQWSIGFKVKAGKFYADSRGEPKLKPAHGIQLKPCTYKSWLLDNKGYVNVDN